MQLTSVIPSYTNNQLRTVKPKLGDVYSVDGKAPQVIIKVHNGTYYGVPWDGSYRIFVGHARRILIINQLNTLLKLRHTNKSAHKCCIELCKLLHKN